MGQKLGGGCALLSWAIEAYTSIPSGILVHPAFWPERSLAENWGGGCANSNTMSPRLMPTSVPSGILIHTAIWPRQTWAEN